MTDRAAAERACKDPNPIIDGRKANVNLAYLGAKPRIQAGTSLQPSHYITQHVFQRRLGANLYSNIGLKKNISQISQKFSSKWNHNALLNIVPTII